MANARYDGLAEWYDDFLKQSLYDGVLSTFAALRVQETGFVLMPAVEPGRTLACWRHGDGPWSELMSHRIN